MFLSKLGYSELIQRLFEKMAFFLVDPLPTILGSTKVPLLSTTSRTELRIHPIGNFCAGAGAVSTATGAGAAGGAFAAGAGARTSSAGAGGETTSAVTATASVPAATFFALFVFHLRAGAAAATAGTTSAGVGAETTRAVAADFIALFVNHLRTGAGAPTSAASAGDFATCATGGPATGGPARLPAPSLAVAPATPATAAESTGTCATGGSAQLPAPSPAVAPATIAQRLGRPVRDIRQGPGSLPSLVKVQEPHSHAMISEGVIARKGLLCFQRLLVCLVRVRCAYALC